MALSKKVKTDSRKKKKKKTGVPEKVKFSTRTGLLCQDHALIEKDQDSETGWEHWVNALENLESPGSTVSSAPAEMPPPP